MRAESELRRPEDRTEFDQLVYALVRKIPPGKIMTYGDIADWIPCPLGLDPAAYRRIRARWVGYALSRCPADVPWHRVVNASGRPSPRRSGSHHAQMSLLEQENTPLASQQRVDLSVARWEPTEHPLSPEGRV
ncbi:MAG: MGMT family protein [Anaerolineales bacterium]|nr:MGMT family protein [Anaerolineales bacterium]